MKYLPKARTDNIVVQALRDEVLIYDLKSDRAFCLNETLAKVYTACGARESFDELKRRYALTDDLIDLALDMLAKENLLAEPHQSKFAGISRRDAIRRVGLATMTALPVIAALTAPHPAQAASTAGALANGRICSDDAQCASNNCLDSKCCSNYGDDVPCAGFRECCFGGNGAVFCEPSATNPFVPVCCSKSFCRKDGDCCRGRHCSSNTCVLD